MQFAKICALTLALIGLSPQLRAETPPGLREAQKAYADVDYEKTRDLAASALRRGGNERRVTAELYLLWATAAAALDQSAEAREAFTYALASNPRLRLDRDLSPKIRAPYLEARGSLSAADGGPPLELGLKRTGQTLELSLRDSLRVAAGVELLTRDKGGSTFVHRRLEAVPTRHIALPRPDDLEAAARVLDKYGNVLAEQGTEEEPQLLPGAHAEPKPTSAASTAREGSRAKPLPYYVASGTLAALGIAAGSVATAMYFRREDAAREWNGTGCEHPGMTRAEQCGPVDDRRRRAEYLSIGFTAAGGVLLAASVVSLVLAPSGSSELSVSAAPGELRLQLRGAL